MSWLKSKIVKTAGTILLNYGSDFIVDFSRRAVKYMREDGVQAEDFSRAAREALQHTIRDL